MIVIDSNVWIFAEDASTDEHRRAASRVEEAIRSGEFGINPIIASEVFHRLSHVFGASVARARLTDIVEHPAARWLVVSVDVVKRAMLLAERAKLRINDAVIAQQATEAQASVLTNDLKDFRKVKGLKVIPL